MKKFFAILLAAIMMLSMTAMAASITITPPTANGTETGITYTAYKIFDATIITKEVEDDEGNKEVVIDKVAYTISTSSPYFTTIQNATDYFTLTESAGDATVYNVEAKDAFTAEVANTFADTLKAVEVASTNTEYCVGTLTKQSDGNYKLDNLANGYYLVTSSVGTDLILDTIGDITVATKNAYPSIDKWVEQDGTVTTTADHDEVLNYGIKVTIPEDATGAIVVHDDMTNQEYVAMTEVSGITAAQNCTDCDVTFTLSAEYVAANKGKTITINYTAKFIGDADGKNEAWLVDDTYTTTKVETTVYTTDVVINKVIAGSTTPLSGAKFVLKNSEGNYYKVTDGTVTWYELTAGTEATEDTEAVAAETIKAAVEAGHITEVTTGADGKAEFENIADGTYYLVETEAPTGYNLLTAPVTVVVNHMTTSETTGEDGQTTSTTAPTVDVTAKVENSTGSELPSTGGIGTTIFYVVGGLMMAAAVVLLVSKRKVAASK